MKKERNFLIMLFIAALTIRLLFSFYLQQFYFGHFEFKYADGPQYLNPVINLINNGEYRGDAFLDDSRYFRPPVYPFFLGIIYLVFSAANLDYVVAGIQCLLGAFSVILVYYIVCNISERKKTALISGIIIALYPFAILWTPLMYTETVQLFLILSMIYLASNKKISIKSTIMQGALVGLILLTKQYMALVIIIPLYIILFTATLTFKKKVIHLCTLMFSFILVLSPWVLRNYMSSGKVIVFFGKTSGLRYALDDAVAFGQFANKFDENTTEYIKSVVETGSVKFVKHPVFLAAHRKDIDAATKLAYQCGGSFLEARQHTLPGQPPYRNCNQEVVRKFDRLSQQFWQEVPFWESMETRIDALWKIVSKSDLVNKNLRMSKNDLLKYGLFKYRILLLVLGFAGMLNLLLREKQHQQKVLTASILITAISFYMFFCLILVSAEMRYLLTPDLLISLFSGVIPAELFGKISQRLKICINNVT